MSARRMAGRIVTAELADGEEWRTENCDACSCECHDDPPKPPGVYITIKLDEYVPGGLTRVTVTEETSEVRDA